MRKLIAAAGLAGALLTGVYAFRMIFLVFGGEPSPYAREHLHTEHGEGPFSMTATVAVLGVLTVVGGVVQIAGIWHPFADFLDPVAVAGREHLALVEPTVTEDWVTSALAVALGLAGIGLAWRLYGPARREVAVPAAVRRTVEHKFYFDELYDALFYRPAAATARIWTRWVEGPVIGGSLTGVAEGTRELGRGVGQAQTGFLRTYALAIAAGVAVLALVFVSVR